MPRTRIQRLVDIPGLTQTPVVEKPLLSQADAAKRMGIGIGSLKQLIASGTVYAVPIGVTGKYFRVPVSEIEKFKGAPKLITTSRHADELAAVAKALDRAEAAIAEARGRLRAYEQAGNE